MIVMILATGMLAGSAAFLVGLITGLSVWTALGYYVGYGLIAVTIALSVQLIGRYLSASARAERMDVKFISEPKLFLKKKQSAHKVLGSLPGKGEDMNILLVDDDDVSLQILSGMLREIGYNRITTCLSGAEAEAIIAAAKLPFDCMFLDIRMPEYDGIELTSAIRKQPEYKETPIIMVTAMTDRNHISRAFTAGADDYVTKPFEIDDLTARISAAEMTFRQSLRASDIQTVDPVQLAAGRWTSEIVQTDRAIGGVITIAAMNNYLQQIERGGLFATNFLAVKIKDYDRLITENKAEETRNLLARVSDVLSAGLNNRHAFIAYAGNGVFACVVNGQHPIEINHISSLADTELTESSIIGSTSSPVQLVYSEPKSFVITGQDQSSLVALYHAIEDAKAQDKCDWETESRLLDLSGA